MQQKSFLPDVRQSGVEQYRQIVAYVKTFVGMMVMLT